MAREELAVAEADGGERLADLDGACESFAHEGQHALSGGTRMVSLDAKFSDGGEDQVGSDEVGKGLGAIARMDAGIAKHLGGGETLVKELSTFDDPVWTWIVHGVSSNGATVIVAHGPYGGEGIGAVLADADGLADLGLGLGSGEGFLKSAAPDGVGASLGVELDVVGGLGVPLELVGGGAVGEEGTDEKGVGGGARGFSDVGHKVRLGSAGGLVLGLARWVARFGALWGAVAETNARKRLASFDGVGEGCAGEIDKALSVVGIGEASGGDLGSAEGKDAAGEFGAVAGGAAWVDVGVAEKLRRDRPAVEELLLLDDPAVAVSGDGLWAFAVARGGMDGDGLASDGEK
jgi:hypothetical protein